MAPTRTADATWMARAMALAEWARDHARPNPWVGCVLVRDGVRIADGWTGPPGQAHAEAAALASVDARGATAYVTLEPCAHHGRTPPCADALVGAGVTRVVVGVADPHTVAAGGADRLRGEGVAVDMDVLGPWVCAQLRGFLTAAEHGRPHVTLKLAQTLDGSLHAPAGRWITSAASRRAVHVLRSRADAVLVGSGTVLADDPRLDVRDVAPRGAQPRPVVLDARGRTPSGARAVRPGTVVVTADGGADWERQLVQRGARVMRVDAGDGGGVDLPEALARLWKDEGIVDVLAEPGQTLASALVDADLVDRSVRHVATSVRAADGRPRIVSPLDRIADWPIARWCRRGADLEVVADAPRP